MKNRGSGISRDALLDSGPRERNFEQEMEDLRNQLALANEMNDAQEQRIFALESLLRKHRIPITGKAEQPCKDYTHYKLLAQRAIDEYNSLLREHRSLQNELKTLQAKDAYCKMQDTILDGGGPYALRNFMTRIFKLLNADDGALRKLGSEAWTAPDIYNRALEILGEQTELNACKLEIVLNKLLLSLGALIDYRIEPAVNLQFNDVLIKVNGLAEHLQMLQRVELSSSVRRLRPK